MPLLDTIVSPEHLFLSKAIIDGFCFSLNGCYSITGVLLAVKLIWQLERTLHVVRPVCQTASVTKLKFFMHTHSQCIIA